MDIYLSINNRERVIKLPLPPKEFTIEAPMRNNVFETVNKGELNLIGLRGLKSIEISSLFPSKSYSFARDNKYKAWDYVAIIEDWKYKRIPIRLVITNTPINMACAIENFTYGINDGSGDIAYTLSLREFKLITI